MSFGPQSGSESESRSEFSRNPVARVRAYDDCHYHSTCLYLMDSAGLARTRQKQRRHGRRASRLHTIKIANTALQLCVVNPSGRDGHRTAKRLAPELLGYLTSTL